MSEVIQTVRLNQVQDFQFDIEFGGTAPPLPRCTVTGGVRAGVPVQVQALQAQRQMQMQMLDSNGARLQ